MKRAVKQPGGSAGHWNSALWGFWEEERIASRLLQGQEVGDFLTVEGRLLGPSFLQTAEAPRGPRNDSRLGLEMGFLL